jgi:hypothetical protein
VKRDGQYPWVDNETNLMWRHVHDAGRERGLERAARDHERIVELKQAGRLLYATKPDHAYQLWNPDHPGRSVMYYATRGTVVEGSMRHRGTGLSVALKILGIEQ